MDEQVKTYRRLLHKNLVIKKNTKMKRIVLEHWDRKEM